MWDNESGVSLNCINLTVKLFNIPVRVGHVGDELQNISIPFL